MKKTSSAMFSRGRSTVSSFESSSKKQNSVFEMDCEAEPIFASAITLEDEKFLDKFDGREGTNE